MTASAAEGLAGLDDAMVDAVARARSAMGAREFLERVGELLRDSGELLTAEVAALVVLDELGLAPEACEVAPVYARVLAPEELEAGLDGVVVEGVLRQLAPTRSFARQDGSRGFVTTAHVEGRVGTYEITLWDEHIRALVRVPMGTRLRLEGLYTKERGERVELHTGREARIALLDP